ncbi:hypothetical protein DSO57_1007951 [Entomophthora muscae]|uniref:Uncharacterized protein n=1 Tax=Entomophthora muscae TaxID=34485 RepID=A0ACC2SW37_9FUNG|nr:hypothetical protein DSO57_1007951 [Entomophthora muscae]
MNKLGVVISWELPRSWAGGLFGFRCVPSSRPCSITGLVLLFLLLPHPGRWPAAVCLWLSSCRPSPCPMGVPLPVLLGFGVQPRLGSGFPIPLVCGCTGCRFAPGLLGGAGVFFRLGVGVFFAFVCPSLPLPFPRGPANLYPALFLITLLI